jgi:hypothetical protein
MSDAGFGGGQRNRRADPVDDDGFGDVDAFVDRHRFVDVDLFPEIRCFGVLTRAPWWPAMLDTIRLCLGEQVHKAVTNPLSCSGTVLRCGARHGRVPYQNGIHPKQAAPGPQNR